MYQIPLYLLFACTLTAQQKYPASEIPRSLLHHADVVVREYDVRFEVLNKGEAIETEHKVVTILDEKGAHLEGEQVFYYSKFTQIEDIEAAVYDRAGQLVRRLKKKDIEDLKPLEYFVSDSRCKRLSLPARAFPYTIEYTVVSHHKGLMFYPVFSPQERERCAVQSARFTLVMPEGLQARYRSVNLPESAQTGPLAWTFKNLPAREVEPYAPAASQSVPRILTAPTAFSFAGFDGDLTTWASYGAFMQLLNQTQRDLPESTKAQLREMVADCQDTWCKTQRIYDFLQNNTRYFFVGLGIGGWQPAPAAEVDQYKYGDCKGLSNYTVAMLEAVGVPAFYTIIRAGETQQQEQFPDFPNAWFNHIIVCVPNGRDSIWLECTSQTESCGFLGDFTDNRPGLLITPEGGKLVQTPVYDATINTSVRQTTLSLAADGSALLESNETYTGLAQNIPAVLEGYSDEFRKKYFYSKLAINNFDINNLVISRKKDRIPQAGLHLSLSIPKLAAVSGKRLFLPVSLLSNKIDIPATDSLRQMPVQADARGNTEEDHLVIQLPEGYHLESVFEPISVRSAFGQFDMSLEQEAGKMTIHRKLVLNNNIQPKEQYKTLMDFFKTITKADKTKLVLVKGT